MCRNIKPLYNFDPPATDQEIRAAAQQFVRKISGFNRPSKANETAFLAAVDEIAAAANAASTRNPDAGRGQAIQQGVSARPVEPALNNSPGINRRFFGISIYYLPGYGGYDWRRIKVQGVHYDRNSFVR
jgi:hypothetical protein